MERTIRDRLAEARPGDGILGEEFGTEGDSTRQWIIDPIDGTANFLRGVPVWGTLIALAVDGVPVVGVASSPAMGRRWWAARGLGAWTTASAGELGADASDATDAASARVPGARRLRVSGVERLADASLSFQSLAQWRDAGYLDRLLTLSQQVWRDRAYGDLWSYALLAEGLIDITGEFDVKPYDLAALVPIVEEAGGRFTVDHGRTGPVARQLARDQRAAARCRARRARRPRRRGLTRGVVHLHRAAAGRELRRPARAGRRHRAPRVRRLVPLRPLPRDGRHRSAAGSDGCLDHPRGPRARHPPHPARHARVVGDVPASVDPRDPGRAGRRDVGRTRGAGARHRLVRRGARGVRHPVPAQAVRPVRGAARDRHRPLVHTRSASGSTSPASTTRCGMPRRCRSPCRTACP